MPEILIGTDLAEKLLHDTLSFRASRGFSKIKPDKAVGVVLLHEGIDELTQVVGQLQRRYMYHPATLEDCIRNIALVREIDGQEVNAEEEFSRGVALLITGAFGTINHVPANQTSANQRKTASHLALRTYEIAREQVNKDTDSEVLPPITKKGIVNRLRDIGLTPPASFYFANPAISIKEAYFEDALKAYHLMQALDVQNDLIRLSNQGRLKYA